MFRRNARYARFAPQENSPVAWNTAMIAASRRCANPRPAHACCSTASSPVVKTGISLQVSVCREVPGSADVFVGILWG